MSVMTVDHNPRAGRPLLVHFVTHTMHHPKPSQYLPVIHIQMQGLSPVVLVLFTVVINIGSVEVGASWSNRQEHRTVL